MPQHFRQHVAECRKRFFTVVKNNNSARTARFHHVTEAIFKAEPFIKISAEHRPHNKFHSHFFDYLLCLEAGDSSIWRAKEIRVNVIRSKRYIPEIYFVV